jgi:hypothetical protein
MPTDIEILETYERDRLHSDCYGRIRSSGVRTRRGMPLKYGKAHILELMALARNDDGGEDMTRRTNYKIVDGTKDSPKKILVFVGSHNKKYGRASLPSSLVGRVVEITVPDPPLPMDALQGGEKPEPIVKKAEEKVEVKVEPETVVAKGDTA